jgi:hypothetical protein
MKKWMQQRHLHTIRRISSQPSSDKNESQKPLPGGQVDEIIEIAPYSEEKRSMGCVPWSRDMDEENSAAVPGAAVRFDETPSTISSTKSRSYKSTKGGESRRLKICIIAGCLVTILCLIVIVVAVVLSRQDNETDLSAAAAVSSQTSVPTVATSVLDPVASPSATPASIPINASIPWQDETSNATSNTTDEQTSGINSSPTDTPIVNPTASTLSPTARLTESTTIALTASPTVMVTALPPPSCITNISVTQDCFFMSDTVIVIQFNNCDPKQDDWVGLYPDGSEYLEQSSGKELLSDNWVSWAWSCGDQSCKVSPATNGFPLAVNPDQTNNLFKLRVYLIRASDSGPPFQVIAKSDSFELADPCNP